MEIFCGDGTGLCSGCGDFTQICTCDKISQNYTHQKKYMKKLVMSELRSAPELTALRPHQFPGFYNVRHGRWGKLGEGYTGTRHYYFNFLLILNYLKIKLLKFFKSFLKAFLKKKMIF